jgi:hypothetical protein
MIPRRARVIVRNKYAVNNASTKLTSITDWVCPSSDVLKGKNQASSTTPIQID